MTVRRSIAAGALCILAAGCGREGIGPDGPSWFHASLAGEVVGSFEGTGTFSFERDYAETPAYFTIRAKGSDPEVEEVFHVRWPTTARPRPGTHPLVPHEDAYGSTRGVTALYWRTRGDDVNAPAHIELYAAATGVVEITHSSGEVVEGTIRFTGLQTTRSAPSGPQRQDPIYDPDPNAERIEVEGTFRAPYSPGFGTP